MLHWPDQRLARSQSRNRRGKRSQVGENDPGTRANAVPVLARFGEDIGAMIGSSTVRSRSTRATRAAGL
jgi:DNA-binding IclR family transcriptional regulator